MPFIAADMIFALVLSSTIINTIAVSLDTITSAVCRRRGVTMPEDGPLAEYAQGSTHRTVSLIGNVMNVISLMFVAWTIKRGHIDPLWSYMMLFVQSTATAARLIIMSSVLLAVEDESALNALLEQSEAYTTARRAVAPNLTMITFVATLTSLAVWLIQVIIVIII